MFNTTMKTGSSLTHQDLERKPQVLGGAPESDRGLRSGSLPPLPEAYARQPSPRGADTRYLPDDIYDPGIVRVGGVAPMY
jgi:hypothetical protein